MKTKFYTSARGYKIAYRHYEGAAAGVLFLPGFRSDMDGIKATALAEYCCAHHLSYTAIDYFAHGETEGDFLEFTISHALSDVLEIIDYKITAPIILVGSSMGGWLALLAALARPEKIAGLIGIAAAPDFTEKLMFERFTDDQRSTLVRDGVLYVPSEYSLDQYPITEKLIRDGRQHLLLSDAIPLEMPLHLIHGQADADVPWHFSLEIAEKILSKNVCVTLIKEGDHRLSRPQDILLLIKSIEKMCSLTNA